MVIRPMIAAYAMGDAGRLANAQGGKGGPASLFAGVRDVVSLGGKTSGGAGLYSGHSVFKIMGTVELMSEEFDMDGKAVAFGDTPTLL